MNKPNCCFRSMLFTNLTACIALHSNCAYAQRSNNFEIIFTKEFREHGWKNFDANNNKLSKLIQTLEDYYNVEYKLNYDSIIIYKVTTTLPKVRTTLSAEQLSREQKATLKKHLRTTQFSKIEKQCNHLLQMMDSTLVLRSQEAITLVTSAGMEITYPN